VFIEGIEAPLSYTDGGDLIGIEGTLEFDATLDGEMQIKSSDYDEDSTTVTIAAWAIDVVVAGMGSYDLDMEPTADDTLVRFRFDCQLDSTFLLFDGSSDDGESTQMNWTFDG
jgi:hypothetical protein